MTTLFGSVEAANQEKPGDSAAKQRLYCLFHLVPEGGGRDMEVFVWAAYPQQALAAYAGGMGVQAELADGGRRKVGLKSRLAELAAREAKSKEAKAILEELRGVLAAEEKLAARQAQARKAVTQADEAQPQPQMNVPDEGQASQWPAHEEASPEDEEPPFEDEGQEPEGELEGNPEFDDEDPEPPGGPFEEDDQEDYSGWDNRE